MFFCQRFARLNTAALKGRFFCSNGDPAPYTALLRAPASNRQRDNGWTGGKKVIPGVITIGAGLMFVGSDGFKSRRRAQVSQCQTNPLVKICVAGKVSDFEEGQPHEVKLVEGNSVLVVKIDGQFHCIGNTCSHFSAPLHKGSNTKEYVSCPWHNAQFDIKTGKPLDGPGLDPIPVYETSVQGDELYVVVPLDFKNTAKAKMAKKKPEDKRVFAIVGGGAAATTAAMTLREEGFTGSIAIYSEEPHISYDRTILSKGLRTPVAKMIMKSEDFWKDADVDLYPNSKVNRVDAERHELVLGDGKRVHYDKVLVATGASPRQLNIPGSDLKNILTLRTVEDRDKIVEFANTDSKVVVIGTSFIGVEVGASLAKAGASVTIVGMESSIFETVLGKRIGSKIEEYCKSKAPLKFVHRAKAVEYRGRDGAVNTVVLDNGEILQADVVILGVGVSPNGEVVQGVDKAKDGSLVCDAFLRTSSEDVYGAGDVVTFPYVKTGKPAGVMHWNVAMQHGRVAARNMLGQHSVYNNVPFFWTMFFGKSLRYTGNGVDFDDVVVEGDLDKLEFVAFYGKEGQVQAVASMGRDPIATAACNAISLNLMPSMEMLKQGVANGQQVVDVLAAHNASVIRR
eukprot:GHVN01069909.1.p1 GENE.GHVN01069909.1~~GHVN01069909.1.p1  ORF type:complete len:624 (-),score=64.56 GHVN01069909.1:3067-4938(-)